MSEPKQVGKSPGRPKVLDDPQGFYVYFEKERLQAIRDLCEKRLISVAAFIRKAVDDFYERVK